MIEARRQRGREKERIFPTDNLFSFYFQFNHSQRRKNLETKLQAIATIFSSKYIEKILNSLL